MIRTIIYTYAAACAFLVLCEGFWYLQDTNLPLANMALGSWAVAGFVSMLKRRKTSRR